jgi:hypothetical protein
MTGPVYKVYLFRRFTEAWHQLSKEEQEGLLAKVQEIIKAVGCKVVLQCVSGWSSDEWQGFGVEEFPNIEAVQKHRKALDELNWYRYVETVSVLGTGMQPS